MFSLPFLWCKFHKSFVLQYVILSDFNNNNKCLAAILLKRGHQYRKLCKAFFLKILPQTLIAD